MAPDATNISCCPKVFQQAGRFPSPPTSITAERKGPLPPCSSYFTATKIQITTVITTHWQHHYPLASSPGGKPHHQRVAVYSQNSTKMNSLSSVAFLKLPFVNTRTPSSKVISSSAVTVRTKVANKTATETPTLMVRDVETVWDESEEARQQDADVASRGSPPLAVHCCYRWLYIFLFSSPNPNPTTPATGFSLIVFR